MTLVSHVLPPILGYFAAAALAVTPQTHRLRLILWPVITSFALRAALSVDLSPSGSERKFRNTLFVFSMIFIITRTFDWTSAKGPLVRHIRPTKSSRSRVLDTLDLAVALRGYGWDWSHGVYFPPETRPANRSGFVFHVALSAVSHTVLCGVLHIAVQSFSPSDFKSLSGGSIFDDTLPFYSRYLRSSLITLITTFSIYAGIQSYYDICTFVGVLVLGQDPAQWPPAFDAPWRATSVADFWGRRWHQFFRRTFLVQGGYPLSALLGRPGFVLGTFLSSAILHHVAMISLDGQAPSFRMLIGFGMMGSLVLVERAFKQVTGRKMGGIVGCVWTTLWLFLLGNMIVDAYARAGVFGHFSFVGGIVPGRVAVQRSVASFDAWLHAI